MTGLLAPWATRARLAHARGEQRPDDEIGAARQRLLRRRRGPVRGRTVVLDEQGEIIAAGLGQGEFGGVAHGDADGAGAARGLRQRQDEADLDRAGADLVCRRGGRRRVGLLRRSVGRQMSERAAGGAAAGQRQGQPQQGERFGQSGADGARQSSHKGGPQDLLAASAACARSSVFPSIIQGVAALSASCKPQSCYHKSRGEVQSQNRSAGNR